MPPMQTIVPGERGIVAQASASPPMLIDINRWGVDQALWLPGNAGNYASIPDANLLDADTAHLHQSIGKWYNSFQGTAGRSNSYSLIGDYSLTSTATGDGNVLVRAGNMPAREGVQYSASCKVFVPAAISGGVRLVIRHYDSTGTGLGDSNSAGVVPVAGEWVDLTHTWTAPAGTAEIQIDLYRTSALTGEVLYADEFIFRTGSNATFVPSHRIVGDIDIRAKIAKAVWGVEDEQYLVAAYGTGTTPGYIFSHGIATSDKLRFIWWEPSVAKDIRSTIAVPVEDQEPTWVRVTVDMDNGASQSVVTFYYSNDGVNWTQLEQIINAGTSSIQVHDNILALGSRSSGSPQNLKGAYFNAEVRDGIDGSIVVSADFTNPAEVTGDNWTTPESHAARLNRSSDFAAVLVDRPCWTTRTSTTESLTVDNLLSTLEPLTMMASMEVDFTVPASSVQVFGDNANFGSYWHSANGQQYTTVGDWRTYGSDSRMDPLRVRGIWGFEYNPETHESRGMNVDNGQWTANGWQQHGHVDPPGEYAGATFPLYPRRMTWFVSFQRHLTDAERAELAAWDGTVANEPPWLRSDPALVLYLNADDLESTRKYASDGVAYMPLSRSRQTKKLIVPNHVAA